MSRGASLSNARIAAPIANAGPGFGKGCENTGCRQNNILDLARGRINFVDRQIATRLDENICLDGLDIGEKLDAIAKPAVDQYNDKRIARADETEIIGWRIHLSSNRKYLPVMPGAETISSSFSALRLVSNLSPRCSERPIKPPTTGKNTMAVKREADKTIITVSGR